MRKSLSTVRRSRALPLTLALAALLATAVFLSACGSPASSSASGSASASSASGADSSASAAASGAASSASSTQLANPMEQVSGLEDFESLGVKMSLPSEATAAEFYIISGEIAEVQFIVNDSSFVYRGSQVVKEGLDGVYEEFGDAETITESGITGGYQIVVDVAPSGTLRAIWTRSSGEVAYSLTATGSIPRANFSEIAGQLAKAS